MRIAGVRRERGRTLPKRPTATAASGAAQGIYVAGAMRSGTTWLGMLLAESTGFLCLGELSGLADHAERGGICTCGEAILDCPLWGPVLATAFPGGRDDLRVAATSLHQRFRTVRLARNGWERRTQRNRRLSWPVEALQDAVDAAVATTGRGGFVDTSKRMGILQAHLQASRHMSVVLIVRNPYEVARSHKRTRETRRGSMSIPPGSSPAAAALRWTVAIAVTVLYSVATKTELVVVQFEDLHADPSSTVESITASLGVPTQTIDVPGAASHVPVGNPTRFCGSSPRPRLDPRGMHEWDDVGLDLTTRERLSVLLLASPVYRFITGSGRAGQHASRVTRFRPPRKRN